MSLSQLLHQRRVLVISVAFFLGCQRAPAPLASHPASATGTDATGAGTQGAHSAGEDAPKTDAADGTGAAAKTAPTWAALARRYEPILEELDDSVPSDRLRYRMALLRFASGQTDNGSALLRDLDPQARPRFGLVGPVSYLADQGEFDDAMALCEEHLSEDVAALSRGLCSIARSKAESGDLEGAKPLLARTPDLQSNTAMVAFESLGMRALTAGDIETAYACYTHQAKMGGLGLVGSLSEKLSVRLAERGDFERAVEVVARCQGERWASAHDRILELATPGQIDSLEQAVVDWQKSGKFAGTQHSFPLKPVMPLKLEEKKKREKQRSDAAAARIEAFSQGAILETESALMIASAGKLDELATLLGKTDSKLVGPEVRRRLVFRALETNQPILANRIASRETDPTYRALNQILIAAVENDSAKLETALQTVTSFDENPKKIGFLREAIEDSRGLAPVVTLGGDQQRRLVWKSLDVFEEIEDVKKGAHAYPPIATEITDFHTRAYRISGQFRIAQEMILLGSFVTSRRKAVVVLDGTGNVEAGMEDRQTSQSGDLAMNDDIDGLTLFVLRTAGRREAIAVYEEETGCSYSDSVRTVDSLRNREHTSKALSLARRLSLLTAMIVAVGGR